MAEVKRVIWIVLDSVGIGELPDADNLVMLEAIRFAIQQRQSAV